MNTYLLLKLLHILSSVLLIGTGFGSAFYLYFINRSKNAVAIARVLPLVVRADWWFTTPAVIVQPLTGIAMLHLANIPMTQTWLLWTYVLFVLIGVCWLPVVWLQIQMAKISQAAVASESELPEQYWRYSRYWELLGYPAFVASIAIYALMVFKPN